MSRFFAANEPLFSDILTISVMYGARNCTTSEVGAGSRRQVAFGDFLIIFVTSSALTSR